MVWNYTNYINHKVGNLLKVQLPVQLFFADAKEMWKPCFTLVLPAGCRTFPYGIRFDKDLQVTFHQPKEPFVQSRSFPVLRDEDNNSRSARQQTGQHQYFTAFQSQTSYLIACQSVLITWWSNSGLLFQKKGCDTFCCLLVKHSSDPDDLEINYTFTSIWADICYIICARTRATIAAEWQTQ